MPFAPHDAATDCISRANDLLDLASGTTGEDLQRDLQRMAVVLAVAALDTYMHRLIVHRVYEHDELPGGLARLDLPFSEALELADDAKQAARAESHQSRPRVGLKRRLRERLLRESFQSYSGVSTALGMAGLSGNWKAIGKAFSPELTSEDIRDRLNEIVRRRNQIVHEGDYPRLERPQFASYNWIDHQTATDEVAFVGELIDAINAVN